MDDSPADLERWVEELAAALDLAETEVPIGLLLDLTRDAAHGVTRPAGPLTTYLVGLAVAQGASIDDAAARVRAAIAARTEEG